MHFLGTILEKHLDIITQLRTANNRVVTKDHTLSLHQLPVGNQFHLRHKVSATLVSGSKATGPGRSIFQDGSLIRDLMTHRIS